MTEKPQANKDQTPDSVASAADNESLEHTRGGAHTRTALDAGVPMQQGKPDEPVGPEDALGTEKTRGDYSGRIDSGPHMMSVPVDPDEAGDRVRYVDRDTGKLSTEGADNAVAVPNERPTAKLVEQTPAP